MDLYTDNTCQKYDVYELFVYCFSVKKKWNDQFSKSPANTSV